MRQLSSKRGAAVFVFASVLLAGVVILDSLSTANAMETPQEKLPKPTASPSPKLGTELDGPVVVNTDLITLTVTVTDIGVTVAIILQQSQSAAGAFPVKF